MNKKTRKLMMMYTVLHLRDDIDRLCSAFNKFPDFFVQAFKIVVDS